MNGVFTRLVEPQTFTVKSIPNALGTPNYNANFDFLKGVSDLNAKVNSARGKISAMNTQLKSMKSILGNTAIDANALIVKIDAMQKEVDASAKIIIGGFGAKNTVASRLRVALYTTSSAQVDITGSQKEQFSIAEKTFNSEEVTLNSLFDVKLPTLEKEFEAAGGILYNNPPSRRGYNEE